MKNILIVNLRRLGDVYTTAHLIHSLNASNNHVSLLTYKESENAARNLKGVNSFFTLDRKEIITLKTNRLFSDGFAFEQLFNQLEMINSQNWDEIINYSNDLVASYICSYLKKPNTKVIGVHFNQDRNIETNGPWELLFNDVLPTVKYAPIHFVDCYHRMANTIQTYEGEKIITNAELNEASFQNMNAIRNSQSSRGKISKIIAIQLKTSDPSKDIPRETLIDLIQQIKSSDDTVPYLLIAPIEAERNYASQISAEFQNELVIIEADLNSAASVLLNTDLLITPDTVIKHIADLVETPVLEISMGAAPFLKQGTYAQDSLILTDVITNRNFKNEIADQAFTSQIKAVDIYASMLYFFSKSKTVKPKLSSGITLYSTSFDQLGVKYNPIAGSVDSQCEIYRLMSRQLINVLYDNNESRNLYSEITNFGLANSSQWVANEKIQITNLMKDLLGTLRALLQSLENRKSSREFITNLSKLISHADSASLVQIPVTMFKTKIESISSKTFEENAKEVENRLYELKSDVQKILYCLKELEETISSQRKADFAGRSI